MQDDRNLFGDHPVNQSYTSFKSHLDDAVMKGKITHLDAMQHMDNLRRFALENKHNHALNYMKAHGKRLGWETSESWHKEENWSK